MRIREKLQNLKENNEMAFISFIMAALPNEDLCLDVIKALEQGGCDMLELGVPFSDPLADGRVIERWHHRGTREGLNLRRGLDFAAKVSSTCAMPLVLFSYFNPIYKMGIEPFVKECRSAGVEGLIVPDVPLDEMGVFANYDIEAIPMVAPSSNDERLEIAAKMDPAFIYCVSVRGVTGVRALPEDEIKDYLQRVRSFSNAPLELGFGISWPEQIHSFRGSADGVIVGSYLAQLIEEYESKPALLPGVIEKEVHRLKMAAKNADE